MLIIRVAIYFMNLIGQPFLVKSYDMRNAFGSGNHDDLNDTLLERATAGVEDEGELESTRSILTQKRKNAKVCIPCDTGPLVMQLGSGGTMGDKSEPEAFMGNFYKTVSKWNWDAYDAYAKKLVFTSPIDESKCDGSMGSFIDDLLRLLPFTDMSSGMHIFNWDNETLDHHLRSANYIQNKDKQETIIGWAKRELRKQMTEAINLEAKALPQLKHLGSMLDPTNNNDAEVRARLNAINYAWTTMGGFWASRTPWRVKRLIFMSLVLSAAIPCTLR